MDHGKACLKKDCDGKILWCARFEGKKVCYMTLAQTRIFTPHTNPIQLLFDYLEIDPQLVKELIKRKELPKAPAPAPAAALSVNVQRLSLFVLIGPCVAGKKVTFMSWIVYQKRRLGTVRHRIRVRTLATMLLAVSPCAVFTCYL